ncbi:MAG: methyltransferase FkbM family [uncultured bacterium]|nr:MAG: methyltransferase FkbM family [uncultured bacterium]
MLSISEFKRRFKPARENKPAVLPQALHQFLTDVHPKVMDIGARSGPLHEMEMLAPYAHFVICEPDVTEAERVKQQLMRQWRDITVITQALARANGTVALHITAQPGLSSIVTPNQAVYAQYQHFAEHPEYKIDHTITVPALTLETAAQQYHLQDVALMKLDTQGSELEILQSGSQSALDEVVAIYIEGELKPFYTDQPLMADVMQFLDRHGFTALEMKRSALRRYTINQVAFSKREIGWVHCLYFRQKRNDGSALTLTQQLRLVCIALTYQYFDYAMWLLEQPAVAAHNLKQYGTTLQPELVTYTQDVWNGLSAADQANAKGLVTTDRVYDLL